MESVLCRLCLSVSSDNDFETLKEIDRKMLGVVVPQIDLEKHKEHKICFKCSKILLKSYEFKRAYIETIESKILTKLKDSNAVKNVSSNLQKKIHGTIIENDLENDAPHKVCTFCLGSIEEDSKYENEQNEDFYLKMIQEKCFPELDVNNSSNIRSCSSCLEILEKQFSFVCSCLETKEKIRNYYCFHDEYNQEKMPLHEIMKFNLKKEKLDSKHQTELIWSNGTSFFVKTEASMYEEENIEISVGSNYALKMEEIEIKTEEKLEEEFKNLENNIPQDEYTKEFDKREMYYCQHCSYQSRFRHNIIRHCFSNKDSLISIYKCEHCMFESNHRCAIRQHRFKHRNSSELALYKCELCTYETIRKGHLNSHMIVHKPKSDVRMYNCEICSYETRHKGALKVHILTHKDASNTIMYKCDICTYETKRKGDLKIHNASRHKELPDVTVEEERLPRGTERTCDEHENGIEEINKKLSYCFTCQKSFCAKGELKIHMFTKHKQSVNIKLHECKWCVYVTPRSSDLKRHVLLHTDYLPYECNLCQKGFNQKNNLKRHLILKHKETKNVKIHTCKLCEYKTAEKGNFNRHLRVHNNDMSFQCEVCHKKFKERYKLNMHIFSKHENNIELAQFRVYQCKLCDYKTPRKNDLNKHLTKHLKLHTNKSTSNIQLII